MIWHAEILSKRQKTVLTKLGPALSERGFFLAGGTAVALHLGHRRSVDFDWFTRESFDPFTLAQQLRDDGIPFVTESESPGTLHGAIHGVLVSFIRHNYRVLDPIRVWRRIHLAARADLTAMKRSAIAQRGAKKDFVDIYALGKRKQSFTKMLQRYRRKFATTDIVHLLRSLTFFDDADRERLPRMLWDTDWRTIKDTIRGWVKKAAA